MLETEMQCRNVLVCTCSASCSRLSDRFLRRNVFQWFAKLFLKCLKGAFVHRSPEKQREFLKMVSHKCVKKPRCVLKLLKQQSRAESYKYLILSELGHSHTTVNVTLNVSDNKDGNENTLLHFSLHYVL